MADSNSEDMFVRPLILIAEDAGIQVKLTRMCLERADFEVNAARDGDEALSSIAARRPDLLILDVEMPKLNGFQVLDKLRKQETTKSIPVIMLTAHGKDSVLFDTWATPRDAFMTKPFSPDSLLEMVREVLTRPVPA